MANNYPKNDLNIPGRAVVQTAKNIEKKSVEVTMSTGVRAEIKTVAASLIDMVTSQISEPEVPMEHNPDKDRDEPNPQSPKYINEVKAYNKARGEAAIEAMIMFGVVLLDPIPPKSEWLDKLQFLEKRKRLDLSKYDLEDPIDLEYLYKSLIAVGKPDLMRVMKSANISTEAMANAEKSFPGDDGRKADTEPKVEG